MISISNYELTLKRDNYECQHPMCIFRIGARLANQPLETTLTLHHIYWRSEYRGTDRDHPWNLVTLHNYCHTSQFGPHENKAIDTYFKVKADTRKSIDFREGGHHPDLKKARLKSRARYRRRVEKFRETHDGKSPTQVRYQKRKEWLLKKKLGE